MPFSQERHWFGVLLIGNDRILIMKQINVLPIIFDSKLQWNAQVCKCIKKAEKSLHALKLIRKYFNTKELLQI